MGELDFHVIRLTPAQAKEGLSIEDLDRPNQTTTWHIDKSWMASLNEGISSKITSGSFVATSVPFRGIKGDGNEIDMTVSQVRSETTSSYTAFQGNCVGLGAFSGKSDCRASTYTRTSQENSFQLELRYPGALRSEKACKAGWDLPEQAYYPQNIDLPAGALIQSVYTTYYNKDGLTDFVLLLNDGGAVILQQKSVSTAECVRRPHRIPLL